MRLHHLHNLRGSSMGCICGTRIVFWAFWIIKNCSSSTTQSVCCAAICSIGTCLRIVTVTT